MGLQTVTIRATIIARIAWAPPLMVYLAFGLSAVTGVAGTFLIKERLGLPASALASLAFWAGLPWALKIPLGQIADRHWERKNIMAVLGAILVLCSFLILWALCKDPAPMAAIWPVERWFVLSSIIGPLGFVMQDVVADAMTVEAVPETLSRSESKAAHTSLQTMGRVSLLFGGLVASATSAAMLAGSAAKPPSERFLDYADIFLAATFIPAISLLGIGLSLFLKFSGRTVEPERHPSASHDNAILFAGCAFAVFAASAGLLMTSMAEETVLVVSMAVILWFMTRLSTSLSPESRRVLWGTAAILFVFRAVPGPGEGVSWWMIDRLGFDPSFLSKLGLISSVIAIFGVLSMKNLMAKTPIPVLVVWLSIAGFVLGIPVLAMAHGFHEWSAAATGGVVDARFIAVANTAVESPFSQIAMIPMLAWIAGSAPDGAKATWFALMASFSNLALSASSVATSWLNKAFVVSRETAASASAPAVSADYSSVPTLLWTCAVIGLAVPVVTSIVISRRMPTEGRD